MSDPEGWTMFGDIEDLEAMPSRIHNTDAETDAVLAEHEREAEHMRDEDDFYKTQCRVCGYMFTPQKDDLPRDLCDDCFNKRDKCDKFDEAMEDANDWARDSIAPEHLTDYDYNGEGGS